MLPRPHKARLDQLNLFQARPTPPSWRNLPSEVRRMVLPLLANLLRADRRIVPRHDDDAEVGHE